MRIVSCCRAYPTFNPGGMEAVCQVRAEELVRQGHEVHVVTAGGKAASLVHNGVMLHYTEGPMAKYSQAYSDECYKLACQLRPDVLHLDSFDQERLWWKDRPGSPRRIAMTYHGFGWQRILTDWAMYRDGVDTHPCKVDLDMVDKQVRGVKSFDVAISISLFEQWQIQDLYAVGSPLVYNPIAIRFFDEPPVPDRPKRPWVVNGKRFPAVAQKVAERAGIPVIPLSGIRPEDMPKTYDGAAGLVLPTYFYIGFDLMVAESLARRRPVVTFALGSYYWAARIFEGIHAVLPGDIEAMGEMISSDLPPVPSGVVDQFRPERHVKNWVEAVQ